VAATGFGEEPVVDCGPEAVCTTPRARVSHGVGAVHLKFAGTDSERPGVVCACGRRSMS